MAASIRQQNATRADLLRLLWDQDDDVKKRVSAEFGYERRERQAEPVITTEEPPVQSFNPTDTTPILNNATPSTRATFLQVINYEHVSADEDDKGPDWWRNAGSVAEQENRVGSAGLIEPALSNLYWPRMQVFLKSQIQRRVPSRRLDERALVRRLARSESLDHLPRKQRRRWPNTLLVLIDRDDATYPLWLDYHQLQKRLKSYLGASVVCVQIESHTLSSPSELARMLRAQQVSMAVLESCRCLILSDFGGSDEVTNNQTESPRTRGWLACLRWLRQYTSSESILSLVGLPVSQLPGSVRALTDAIYWDRQLPPRFDSGNVLFQSDPLPIVSSLVAMLSMTAEARPRLLRKLRQLQPSTNALWVELAVWNHADVLHRLPGCWVHPEQQTHWQGIFQEQLAPALQKRVLDCIESDHRAARAYVRDQDALLRNAVDANNDYGGKYVAAIMREVITGNAADAERNRQLLWLTGLAKSTDSALMANSEQLSALAYLSDVENSKSGEAKQRLGQDRFAYLYQSLPVQRVSLRQVGEALVVDAGNESAGSPVIEIDTCDGLIDWQPSRQNAETFWLEGPPNWATDWGQDKYGLWVDCAITADVLQRFRWIDSGSFLMGSPADEPERELNEIQHEVTLSDGYWLADSACTQALWQSVMHTEPSRFKGTNLPVEQVSWTETMQFIQQINQQNSDFQLQLPTEAQWEYACRAGTSTPFSFGDQILPVQVNYDGNFPYAGGEQGMYREKTVPVKSLTCNRWGLFQMHGNVWEWCADWFGEYSSSHTTDPEGDADGELRVLRGGSWINDAGNARSAFRNARVPGYADDTFGFRLSRGPRGARPADTPSRVAEPRRGISARSNVLNTIEQIVSEDSRLIAQSPIIISSDRARLTLNAIEKPGWADAIGRDQFGLYADVTIESIAQRFRWINPGRFDMGSPETEAERGNNEVLHTVTLSSGYWLADTTCTQALWQAVMDENPSTFKGAQRPVDSVSWNDVMSFVEQINKKNPELAFQLPTEAQWEHACRAGSTTVFCFGDQIDTDLVNYDGNSVYKDGEYRRETVDVKSLQHNQWGLFQMHGNVLEWCSDWFGDYEKDATVDPERVDMSGKRVLRGGSWIYKAGHVRSASRAALVPGHTYSHIGFRLSRGSATGRAGGTRLCGIWPGGAWPDNSAAARRMKYFFTRIPVIDTGACAEDLNRFCTSHKVVEVNKYFVADDERSFWAFCVGYLDSDGKTASGNSRPRVDYREILDEEDFVVFAKLRTARKELSESDGVPPYAVFTNEQLAAMVTGRVSDRQEMRRINGIGETRVEKYADAMLVILTEKRTDNAPTKD